MEATAKHHNSTHDHPHRSARELATAYFESWRDKDFDRYQSLLDDNATFSGPLGTAKGAEDCRKGLEGLARVTTDIVVRKMLADGTDVLTWFDLHTSVAPPIPVTNWTHVAEGHITAVQVTFDPRPMISGD